MGVLRLDRSRPQRATVTATNSGKVDREIGLFGGSPQGRTKDRQRKLRGRQKISPLEEEPAYKYSSSWRG